MDIGSILLFPVPHTVGQKKKSVEQRDQQHCSILFPFCCILNLIHQLTKIHLNKTHSSSLSTLSLTGILRVFIEIHLKLFMGLLCDILICIFMFSTRFRASRGQFLYLINFLYLPRYLT